MITFSIEPGYDKFYAEAEPLILEHWAEVGRHNDVLTLNIQHGVYQYLDANDMMDIIVARDEQGVMVGYFFLLLTKHPRDITKLLARDDITYVKPSHRRDWAGYKMLKFALNRAIERGAFVVSFGEKAHRNGYLRRLGFTPAETIYTMVVGK